MKNKLILLLMVVSAGFSFALIAPNKPASAAFASNNIMDDATFDNSTTMSVDEIQNFLNPQFHEAV